MSNDLLDKETVERFTEGLKKAGAAALELGRRKKSKAYLQVADSLNKIRITGIKIYNTKSLTRAEILESVDARVGKKVEEGESTH